MKALHEMAEFWIEDAEQNVLDMIRESGWEAMAAEATQAGYVWSAKEKIEKWFGENNVKLDHVVIGLTKDALATVLGIGKKETSSNLTGMEDSDNEGRN